MPNEDDDHRLNKIDELLRRGESLADATARNLLEDTIRALMDLHGEVLSRIMHGVSQGPQGSEMLTSLANDPVISSLLLVYNLHPDSIELRVRRALDSVRPYLASHGGSVELLNISDEGVVNLQMQGSCHGCPSSAVTLKSSIEKAIHEIAPDVTAIQVQDLESPAPIRSAPAEFVPFGEITRKRIHLPLIPPPRLTGAAI